MDEGIELVPYKDAIERSGLSRRTWYDRLRESRDMVRVYQDGRDRRRRLIDVRDIEKLAEVRPAPRPEAVA